jgi:hypothetical protein
MIYISVTLKSSEISDVGNIISALIVCSREHIAPEDIYHYHNMISLRKRILDKHYLIAGKKSKPVKLKININEYATIRYVYNIERNKFISGNMIFFKILIENILNQCDKLSKNYIPVVIS